MLNNMLIAAVVAATILLSAFLLFEEGDVKSWIMVCAIAISIGWNIFNTLDARTTKKRDLISREFQELVSAPLRTALNQIADSKNQMDTILTMSIGEEILGQLKKMNENITQEFVSLTNACGRIDKFKRPEFGSDWSTLLYVVDDQVKLGFDILLNSDDGQTFDKGVVMVQRALDDLNTSMQRKIYERFHEIG